MYTTASNNSTAPVLCNSASDNGSIMTAVVIPIPICKKVRPRKILALGLNCSVFISCFTSSKMLIRTNNAITRWVY